MEPQQLQEQLLINRIQTIIKQHHRGLALENIGAAWRLSRVPRFHPPASKYAGFYFDKYKKCIYAFTLDSDVDDWEDYAQEYIITSWHNPDPVVDYTPAPVEEKSPRGRPRKYTGQRKKRSDDYLGGEALAEEIGILLEEGMKQSEIARKFEISAAYVCMLKKKYLTPG